jgi:hypothetical protein
MWWTDYLPIPWMFFGPVIVVTLLIIGLAITFLVIGTGMISRPRCGRHSRETLCAGRDQQDDM